MPAKTIFQESKSKAPLHSPKKAIKTSQDDWAGEPPHGWERVFLNALRSKPNLSWACKEAKVLRDFVVDRAASDNDFKNRVDSAIEEGRDRLEEVMFDEALSGNVKYAELFMKLWKTGTKPGASDVKKLIVGWED